MNKYNLENEINTLLEEKVFKRLEHSLIAVKDGLNYMDIDFLINGEWIKIDNWGGSEENKKTIQEYFKNNHTILFFEDMFDFCKWFIETKGKRFDKTKYSVIGNHAELE